MSASVDLGSLGFDGGAHVLVKLALAAVAPGERIAVTGDHDQLLPELAAWCRAQGHRLSDGPSEDDRPPPRGESS